MRVTSPDDSTNHSPQRLGVRSGALRVRHFTAALVSITFLLALLLVPSRADAQIKQPGAHPDYSVELEPHGVLHWANEPNWADEGYGLGLRATIPFLDNGPISKINNNMGIGFGLDWAHFDDPCYWNFYNFRNRGDPRFFDNDNCSTDQFWLPVVLQWNFFFTPVVSVFGEPGLAIVHTRWSFEYWCDGIPGGPVCDYDDTDTDPEFVFWGGGRFLLGETVGIVVRVGTPSLTVGATFLL